MNPCRFEFPPTDPEFGPLSSGERRSNGLNAVQVGYYEGGVVLWLGDAVLRVPGNQPAAEVRRRMGEFVLLNGRAFEAS